MTDQPPPLAPPVLHLVVMGGAGGADDPGNIVRLQLPAWGGGAAPLAPPRVVVAFTGERHARECAARLNAWVGTATPFEPYRPDSPHELATFLVRLQNRGTRTVLIDPASGGARRVPLHEVVRAALRAAGLDPAAIDAPCDPTAEHLSFA